MLTACLTQHRSPTMLNICLVPRTRTNLVDWTSSVAGWYLWNNLSLHLCNSGLTLVRVPPVAKDAPVCWWPWCLVSVALECLANLHTTYSGHSKVEHTRVPLSQLFFESRVLVQKIKKYRVPWEEELCNYVTQQKKVVRIYRRRWWPKKGHISLLRVTRCQIVWALPPPESYFDHFLLML